ELIGAPGTSNRNLGGAGWAGKPGGPYRLGVRTPRVIGSVAGTLIDDPVGAGDVDRSGRVRSRMDRADQLVLVCVALGQAQEHPGWADVSHDRRRCILPLTGRRVGSPVLDAAAAAGVGRPARGQPRQSNGKP